MEIILKQDVPNLGFKDDLVTVKDGYATNYLIPKGLAIIAIPSEKKKMAETIRQRQFKEEKVRKEAEKMAEKLQDIEVRIAAKVGTSGKIFGSVNALQIAEAIKEQFGLEIDRKKIMLDGDAIKEVGTYTAKINLHKEVRPELKFEVFGE
ncbi:MAG: 50S ribosomal protein L9 [Bacteroidia bacterium]|nr:MAG: 50S ribosomal protein L9 [Bacteroidia bacterium]